MTALPQLISESQVLRLSNLCDTPSHRQFVRSRLPSTMAAGATLYSATDAATLATAVAGVRGKQNQPQPQTDQAHA